MQSELPNTTGASKPDGWPRWLWHLVRLFVAPEHRTELMTPDQRAKTARALADNLLDARKSAKTWRDRALSAERCISYEVREAIKAACGRHDKEHGTMLGFRL